MKRPIDKNTLFEFFDGKTTSIQRKMIEEWLQQPGNGDLYYRYLDEWESRHTQFIPDETAALEKYRLVMVNNQEAAAVAAVGKIPFWRAWLGGSFFRLAGIAASLLIVSFWIWKDGIFYRQYDTPFGKTVHYTLADGTQVALNANSRLRVPRFGFNEDTRQVRLEGEAAFDVAHTPGSSRFVVEMDDGYSIEVLGTKFVAFARDRNKRVYLTEGKVKMVLPEGRQIYMKPGHLFEATENRPGTLSVPEKPQQYLAWKTHQFYFDNTPLSEVVRQMEERFGVIIRIVDPALEEKELGGIYEAQSPDDLLQVLAELYHVEISQNKNRIELRSGSNL